MRCVVVSKDVTMMKNSNAVVRIEFCASRTRQRNVNRVHSRMSLSIQISFVIKPKNHLRRCFSKLLKVWTASVLQNEEVLMPI